MQFESLYFLYHFLDQDLKNKYKYFVIVLFFSDIHRSVDFFFNHSQHSFIS
jgi:hypothetical protein